MKSTSMNYMAKKGLTAGVQRPLMKELTLPSAPISDRMVKELKIRRIISERIIRLKITDPQTTRISRNETGKGKTRGVVQPRTNTNPL